MNEESARQGALPHFTQPYRNQRGGHGFAGFRLLATDVRSHDLGLRWTLRAFADDLAVTITADTTCHGRLVGLQSGSYVGTTGDDELDSAVEQHILDRLAARTIAHQLDAIDAQRADRAQRQGRRLA